VARANHAFNDSALAQAFIDDENRFIGTLHIVTAGQREQIEVPLAPARENGRKRVAVYKRRAGLRDEQFLQELSIHANLLKDALPLAGYRQNNVIERELVKGRRTGHDELPIDEISEFWIEDDRDFAKGFDTMPGKRVKDHAATF